MGGLLPRMHNRTFVITLILCLIASCERRPRELVLSGPTMGTTYMIRIVEAPHDVDRAALGHAVQVILRRIDGEMSGYRGDSEIARFNASSTTDWMSVSEELADVVELAQGVGAASGGAFDVTVAPLVKAWGFGPEGESAAPPDSESVAATRADVDYRKLHVRREPPALRKEAAGISVDLNGVAPGYAVDRIAELLRSMRIESFLVELGGEVRARGRNARSERWRVAVERPQDEERAPYAVVQLDDNAVATSGEYRNYYVLDGRRYSHTIDPGTARPVDHDLASVVVVAPTAAEADAWATAYNVLGANAGFALATRLGMPVMFIERRGDELVDRATTQFEAFVVSRER